MVHTLIDRDPHRTSTIVPGWRVAALPGRVYPALIPDPDATASGQLLDDLTAAEWHTLDAFEADFYTLTRVTIPDHQPDHAWTYATNDPTTVEPTVWNPDTFAEQHLPAYLTNCTRWRQHHDTTQ
ncbi:MULTISPECIES: gamma-glutamylcyclotransferase family protein [Protofrankia]|uniref:gamma-glutamylcyclotransferase family protein n=1 Tax=Protofrankia TaxID=2994361 RepID=UPI00069B9ADA|nr:MULTISPECIES: gamma-glutamylcyclotransferase family protein [Protofrankia]